MNSNKPRIWKEKRSWLYGSPALIACFIAGAAIAMAMALGLIYYSLFQFSSYLKVDLSSLIYLSCFFVTIAAFAIIAAVREKITRTDMDEMMLKISQRLFHSRYGNPLGLKDGDILPRLTLNRCLGIYKLRIYCASMTIETLSRMDQVISDCLTGRLASFAVTRKEEDIAGSYIDYTIEDVIEKTSRQRIIRTEHDILSGCSTHKLPIRDDMIID